MSLQKGKESLYNTFLLNRKIKLKSKRKEKVMAKDYNSTERKSRGVDQDIFISKKLLVFSFFPLKLCTVSGKLVDFRKTNFL